jgi:16S rRNA (guanine(1405)-N(7))-methyltransferase
VNIILSAEQILTNITESRKYSYLSTELILRIIMEESLKYKKDKDIIKSVKNKLHQMYGAFQTEDCYKTADGLLDKYTKNSDTDLKNLSSKIMELHSSTKERVNILEEFYGYIFDMLPGIESIIDIGCGYNPFCLPWMPMEKIHSYYAYDIDNKASELINKFFTFLNLPQTSFVKDSAVYTPTESADAAFLFKLIPVLENQKKDRGFEILNELNTKKIVITYPIKTLCGHSKGMEANYTSVFENKLPKKFDITERKVIGSELIYIITIK